VSLIDLVSFSSDLAHHLLQQPRAALRILDASAVAAQEVLLLRGALAAANTVLPIQMFSDLALLACLHTGACLAPPHRCLHIPGREGPK